MSDKSITTDSEDGSNLDYSYTTKDKPTIAEGGAKALDDILKAVEGHGKYHTSAYDGPVMTVEDVKAALLSLLEEKSLMLYSPNIAGGTNEYPAIPLSVVRELLA